MVIFVKENTLTMPPLFLAPPLPLSFSSNRAPTVAMWLEKCKIEKIITQGTSEPSWVHWNYRLPCFGSVSFSRGARTLFHHLMMNAKMNVHIDAAIDDDGGCWRPEIKPLLGRAPCCELIFIFFFLRRKRKFFWSSCAPMRSVSFFVWTDSKIQPLPFRSFRIIRTNHHKIHKN